MPSESKLTAADAINRIDTIHWVAHTAMISMERYRRVLSDRGAFAVIYPGVSFDNPKITHHVDGHSMLLTTTKQELLEPHNNDLYRAWQIVLAVAGMSSVLDVYLRSTAERITGKDQKVVGIFAQFSDTTGIRISSFTQFTRLRHYHEVRNISLHNLGRVNQRFRERTAEPNHADGPYVYYPHEIREYRDILEEFIGFVEENTGASP